MTLVAGRISLLILVTGLFAAAWSGDHAPVTAGQPAAPAHPYEAEPVRETAMHRWHQPQDPAQSSSDHEWIPTADQLATDDLPAGLPAGMYLVIDPYGRIERFAVGADESGSATDDSPTSGHFQAEFRGQLCHWLRILDTNVVESGRAPLPVARQPQKSISR